MSVKSKIKRLNRELEQLKQDNKAQASYIAHIELNRNKPKREELLENIIKFAITNHIGNLRGGMMVDCYGIDKMNNLILDIERSPFEHAYIMRVRY